jgi:hypothetical protein
MALPQGHEDKNQLRCVQAWHSYGPCPTAAQLSPMHWGRIAAAGGLCAHCCPGPALTSWSGHVLHGRLHHGPIGARGPWL